jgi:RimJ/RimL family protein N-acetyltransferase
VQAPERQPPAVSSLLLSADRSDADGVHELASYLPLTRIVATSGPVTVRIPTGAEIAEQAAALHAGGLDDEQSRRSLSWQPATPAVAATDTVTNVMSGLATKPGELWVAPFFVFVNGKPIGRQDVRAAPDWQHLRTASTGSYLVNSARGVGYGTHARVCALAVAWALGARRSVTAWRVDNAASAAVSRKLGYVENGVRWWWDPLTRTEVVLQQAFVTPDRFASAWAGHVEVSGVDDEVLAWVNG